MLFPFCWTNCAMTWVDFNLRSGVNKRKKILIFTLWKLSSWQWQISDNDVMLLQRWLMYSLLLSSRLRKQLNYINYIVTSRSNNNIAFGSTRIWQCWFNWNFWKHSFCIKITYLSPNWDCYVVTLSFWLSPCLNKYKGYRLS